MYIEPERQLAWSAMPAVLGAAWHLFALGWHFHFFRAFASAAAGVALLPAADTFVCQINYTFERHQLKWRLLWLVLVGSTAYGVSRRISRGRPVCLCL
jgi:hypothetical protein